MTYQRKTKDAYELHQNFGYGFECVLTEDSKHETLLRLREYRDNQPEFPVRVVKKRIPLEVH